MKNQNDKVFIPLIAIVSVAVPLIVAVLIFLPSSQSSGDESTKFLPLLNACINSGVAILLVAGFVFIRQKKITLHRTMMVSALVLSVLFLISYLTYHYSKTGHSTYGGEGWIKAVYLFILLTHIVLSAAIVPMALLSVYRGWTNQIEKHRKIAKITLPIWLYVAVTGVIVYLMAHPFNPANI